MITHDRRRPPDPDTRRARHVPALRTEGEDGVSIDRINLRGSMSDHTVSIDPPRRGERVWLNLTPDSPLTYGYEEAGTYLDRQSLGRLLHWLQTGEALPRDDERIPDVFGGQSA